MLKPLSGVLKYIWNPEDEKCDSLDNNETPEGMKSPPETKLVSGKVTSIHSGYGMIDNDIYFALESTEGHRVPQLNDDVEVDAIRQQNSTGWRAVNVRIITPERHHTWEDGPEAGVSVSIEERNNTISGKEEQVVVGMVTRTGKDGGVVNESYNFLFSDCCIGYVPHKGDWVNVKLSAGPTLNVLSVKPLREQSFEGKVNVVQTGFGYINADIYFTFSVCEEGYTPRRGERVCGKAIEITRGRSTWRALSVVPIQGNLADKFISPEILRSPMQLKSLKDLYAEKKGVSVTDPIDFGKVQLGNTKTFSVWIRNSGTSSQTLESVQVKCSTESQFHLTSGISGHRLDTNLELQPGASTKVLLHCSSRYLGTENQLLVVNFSGFQIGRQVAVCVTDPHQFSLTSASRPYEKRAGFSRYRATQEAGRDAGWVVPGQRPQSCQPNIQLPNRLPQYPVPSDLRTCFLEREDLVCSVPALGEEVTIDNYARRFQTLLHLEEIQEEIDIRDYDLERVCLRPCGEFLALTVPGLAEGRPSVLIGDRVILSEPVMPENSPEYEGYIHEVMRDEVLLKFEQNFHSNYRGEDYNARFTFNRTTLRRCHQAIEFAPSLGTQVLFPEHLLPKPPQTKTSQASAKDNMSPVTKQSPASIGRKSCPLGMKQKTETFKFFNKKLNARQKAAVTRILRGQSRPTPYILFGPPGTGKTVTVVESILQIFTGISGSRIIASAPSNSAADLLCERLHESGVMGEGDMVRLNAFQRTQESMPESIRPYTCTGTNLELVSRYRVLVCTCVSAGMMFSLGLKAGHFTHAFVDEAGQATEPECMIPIGLVAGTDGQVVLAGDPMQLGPVLQSREAKDLGLGMSVLERLIHRKLYTRDEQKFYDHGSYDPLLVTKLVENYRSHPALISLPSKLFYHNELVVSAEKGLIECLCDWEELPNKTGCPLIFHGMRGEDLREGNSPSWFNPVEAVQVMKYLQAVVSNPVHTLSFDDIGIITPYRKQVEKIRLLIDKLGMERVKVGSVEEFQGQERLVMIISTVRSNESHVGIDLRHNLGFLSNEKRFNVAITRAQALLIVIGNPHVLYQDQMWKSLIKYAVDHNAYIGCDLPELGETEDSVTEEDTQQQNQSVEEIASCDLEITMVPPSDLEKKIIRQMEYYFGDMNLIRDTFLQDQMQQGQDGWVDLSVILTFNKMKDLSTDREEVCTALEKSDNALLEVNKERTHVRRSLLLPLVIDFELWKEQMQKRAIVVEGLKIASTGHMESFQNFLETEFGEVEHLERGIPKVRKGRSGPPPAAQLVVFRRAESVDRLPVLGQLVVSGRECWLLPPHHLAVDECINYFYNRHVKKLDRRLLKPVGKYWYTTRNSNQKSDKTQRQHRQQKSEANIQNVVVNTIIEGPQSKTQNHTSTTNTADTYIVDREQTSYREKKLVSSVSNGGCYSKPSMTSEKAARDPILEDTQYSAGASSSEDSTGYGMSGQDTDDMESKARIDMYMNYMEKDGIKYVRRKNKNHSRNLGAKNEAGHDMGQRASSSPISQDIYRPLSENVGEFRTLSDDFQQNLQGTDDKNAKSSTHVEDLRITDCLLGEVQSERCGSFSAQSIDSSMEISTMSQVTYRETACHGGNLANSTKETKMTLVERPGGENDDLRMVSESRDSVNSGTCANKTITSPLSRNRAIIPGIGRGTVRSQVQNGKPAVSTPGKPVNRDKERNCRSVESKSDSDESHTMHRILQETQELTETVLQNTNTKHDAVDFDVTSDEQRSPKVTSDPYISPQKSPTYSSKGSLSQSPHLNNEGTFDTDQYFHSQQIDHNPLNSEHFHADQDNRDLFNTKESQSEQDYTSSSDCLSQPSAVYIMHITSDDALSRIQSLPNYYCPELAQSDSDVIIEEEEYEEEEELVDNVTGHMVDHVTGHMTGHVTDQVEDNDKVKAYDMEREELNYSSNCAANSDENWT